MSLSTHVGGDIALDNISTKFDVSIILNIHRESAYLQSTLMSLSASAEHARERGCHTQLVAVFDRSNAATRSVFAACKLHSFTGVKVIEVDVGSLGKARNAGIEAADGEFIWTSDADDLVSFNCITDLMSVAARNQNQKTVVFCEYCIGFGERFFIGRYESSSLICAADFANTHPYVSRLFVHRSAFETLRYRDLKLSNGFAYEDWDLNARLFAHGYNFEIAHGTAFFYRQRPDSLLRQAEQQSAAIIPHCELFEPCYFVESMLKKRGEKSNWASFIKSRNSSHGLDFREDIFSSPILRRAITEAAWLDPEISPRELERAPSYCPIPSDPHHWGFALEDAFGIAGSRKFSDVVILPWLLPGGAEKYILQIVDLLSLHNPNCHVLILTGERVSTVGWQERLRGEYVFLDVYNAFPSLDEESRDKLTVRLLLSCCSEGARIHFKPSIFAQRILDRFAGALSVEFELIYYRFCDEEFFWRGELVRDQSGIRFLRKHLSHVSSVIYDSESVMKRDISVVPALAYKAHCVYAFCSPPSEAPQAETVPQFRLLWASRISAQKRPDLILPLCTALFRRAPHIQLDVYGSADEGQRVSELVRGPNVEYLGSFDNFHALPVWRYDALLYTSAYDGLPNIILESMATGLSVIAPGVGGVADAITPETGFIVVNTANQSELVNSYVDAILAMYDDWQLTLAKRAAARTLIDSRHDANSFKASVSRAISSFKVESEFDHANVTQGCLSSNNFNAPNSTGRLAADASSTALYPPSSAAANHA